MEATRQLINDDLTRLRAELALAVEAETPLDDMIRTVDAINELELLQVAMADVRARQ